MVNRVVRVYLLPFVTVGIGEGPRPASLTSPRRGPCGVIETGRTVSPHRFTMYLSSLLTALLAGPVTRDARVSAIPTVAVHRNGHLAVGRHRVRRRECRCTGAGRPGGCRRDAMRCTRPPTHRRRSTHPVTVVVGLGPVIALPVPVRQHRAADIGVDDEDPVAGGAQRCHPGTAVALDADDHPVRDFLHRQIRPVSGNVFGDQCVCLPALPEAGSAPVDARCRPRFRCRGDLLPSRPQ